MFVDPSHSTSYPLPVHLGTIDVHMRCPIIRFYKKLNFPKFADRHTDMHTDKKVISKDTACSHFHENRIICVNFYIQGWFCQPCPTLTLGHVYTKENYWRLFEEGEGRDRWLSYMQLRNWVILILNSKSRLLLFLMNYKYLHFHHLTQCYRVHSTQYF